MISPQQFSAMIPTNRHPEVWYDIAVDMFRKYDIMTINRIAGFMAQCGHESRDFTALEENLNYSVSALLRVFPRYFGPGKRNPAEYARNPEKLANYVYMDKYRTPRGAMGNIYEGDGWRFRGRGIKQLTGRNNYTAFANSVGMTPEEAAEYLSTPKGAFESACWFWKTNRIDRYADNDDIVGMSRAINGGDIGLADRKIRYDRAKTLLSGNVINRSRRLLIRGSEGEDVAELQRALGIYDDGIFGGGTEKALMNWQRRNGLSPDGKVGSNTYKILFQE